ncbi:MAG: translocation/assembly module TamB domain-containing protein [Gemmatimonadota bacterium]|nr:translocation/assembly module TamB domain-containing protein [Gemmatimonadota bacterium]
MVAAGLAVTLATLVGALLVALQIDAVSGAVARKGAELASSDALRIRVTGATGSWLGGLDLTGVEVTARSGDTVAWTTSVDTLSARYRLLPLLRRQLSLSSVRVVGWSASADLPLGGDDEAPAEDAAASQWTVRVDRVAVDVTELALTSPDTAEPWRLTDGRLRLRDLALGPERLGGSLDTLTASFRPPERPAGWGHVGLAAVLETDRVRIDELSLRSPESDVRAAGSVPLTLTGTAPEGLDLGLAIAPLHLQDVAPFLPAAIPDSLRVRGEGTLRTTADTLQAQFSGDANVPGRVALEGRLWGPRAAPDATVAARVTSLDLQAWGLTSAAFVFDGTAESELRRLSREDIGAMHGSVGVEARIEGDDGSSSGRASVEARADSAGAPWRGRWAASGAGLSTEGGVALTLGDDPEWTLDGALAYRGSDPAPRADMDEADIPTGFPVVSADGRFAAEGRGFAPDSLDGVLRVELDSLRARLGASDASTRVGPGTLTAELQRGDASARMELDAGGGRAELEVEGSLPDRSVRSVQAHLHDIDVARLVGDTVPSRIRAELSGSMPGTAPLQASGDLRILHASYGPWTVDTARASVEARGEDVSLRLSAALPDSALVAAGGRIRWNETGVREAALDSLSWSHLNVRALGGVAEDSPVPPTRLAGTGQGRVERVGDGWRGALALLLGPSDIGDAVLDRGTADVRMDPSATELTLTLEAGDMRVDARGRMDAPAPDLESERTVTLSDLRFRDLDLGALTAGSVPPTRLTGAASGEVAGATLAEAVGSGLFALSTSSVDSTVIDTASIALSLDSGRIRTEARAEGLETVLLVDGEADVGGAAPTYSMQGSLDRRASDTDTDLSALARFGLEGSGLHPDTADAELWVEVDSARWTGRTVDRGVLRAGLREGVARIDTLALSLPGASLVAGGELPLSAREGRSGTLHMSGELTRADLLGAGASPGILAVGEARLEVTARGALDDLTLDGEGHLSALLANDIRVQGVELDGTGRHTAGEGWVQGEGRVVVDRLRLPTAPVERIEVSAVVEPEDELALTASAVVDGRRDAELSARLEQLSAPSSVLLERMSFRADEDRWSLTHPTRVTVRDGFAVDSLRFAADGQELRLRGGITDAGPLDLQASARSFDIATVSDLLGYPDLGGRFTGSLDVGGTAEDPVLDGHVESRLEPGGVSPADLALSLGYREGRADLEGSVSLDEGPELRARASVPFDLTFAAPAEGLVGDGAMSGTLAANSFPLGWLEPFTTASGAEDLEGRLDGTAEVDGTPDDPVFSGRLALENGAVSMPDLGVRYREARAHLTFRGTEIAIDSARVRSEDGTLRTSGRITVERIDRPEYALALTADRFVVMRSSAIHATVSGDVDIEGAGDAPRISGLVEVERADLYLGDLISESMVDPVTLTPEQWEELARVFGYERPSGRTERSPLMESITLDLDVRLGRASWVRQRANPELALQFDGEMSVQKEPGDSLQLVGSVEAVPDRSWVEQFGRRFSITEGRLTFQGPPTATAVEVRAEYGVPSRDNAGEPEVVLALQVSGTPDDLSLELSSTPPLEPSDMVAYLVTGRPASQSLSGGGDGSLRDTGGALALGQLSGAVEAYAREQVGLDVVEITTDGLDGVTLLAGRYLSPDLYLGVRQPISLQSSSEDATQRAPTTEVELELQAVRWLLLNLRAGGRRGVEFYVRSRLAYD